MKTRIYLAGPDVFRSDCIEHGEKLKAKCEEYGFTGLYPMDGVVDFNQEKSAIREDIFRGNLSMIKEADVVIANVSPFRGDSADVGTVWEIGCAYGMGKIIIAYTNDSRTYKERVDASGNTDPEYPIIEDFDAFENLMIAQSTYLVHSFEEALELLQQLNKKAA